MKHIYAIENSAELFQLQAFVQRIEARLNGYLSYLRKEYKVVDLPRSVVWTKEEIATKLISSIPLPAYTNEFRTIMVPDIEVWRRLYFRQLDCFENTAETEEIHHIRSYYSTAISENHILQILGHEFVHHSELFLDGFDTSDGQGIWFEEGMAEYISRKYFLSEQEFQAEAEINRKLVALLRPKYGMHSLEEFGLSTYQGDYASIFYEYWRSFLAIDQMVKAHHGSVLEVFDAYHKWDREGRRSALVEWFHVSI